VLYVTEYTYDLYGNLLTTTYPGGRVITYTYNQLNKVASATDTYLGVTRALANNITYQPVGDITSMTYGNGVVTTRTYNNHYQLNGLNIGNLKELTYTRDNAGNITAITDTLNPSKNRSYTYDNLYRLILATGQWGSLTYAYNPVGNRTYETTNTGNTSYTYNANKLVSASGEKALSFSYDNDGNTTAENNKQYIYNQNQRLTQVTDTGTVLGEYVYNAKGQRVKKTVNGQTTIFHFDQNGLLIAESTSTGTITAEYAYLNGQPLAKIESNNVYYYHNDHLGTPMLTTESSGSIVWQGEFKPFGEPLSVSGSVTNNLRFPGQYYDAETGLHQNYFRDYSPQLGRYLEGDPIGIEKGENHMYVYVNNAPSMKIDVTGLYPGYCGNKDHTWVTDHPYFIFNFNKPCEAHDNCYDCQGAKEGKSKTQCDRDFFFNMQKTCYK
jgi:RHS repeat-associated protein